MQVTSVWYLNVWRSESCQCDWTEEVWRIFTQYECEKTMNRPGRGSVCLFELNRPALLQTVQQMAELHFPEIHDRNQSTTDSWHFLFPHTPSSMEVFRKQEVSDFYFVASAPWNATMLSCNLIWGRHEVCVCAKVQAAAACVFAVDWSTAWVWAQRHGGAEKDPVCWTGVSGHHQRGGQISWRRHRQQVKHILISESTETLHGYFHSSFHLLHLQTSSGYTHKLRFLM